MRLPCFNVEPSKLYEWTQKDPGRNTACVIIGGPLGFPLRSCQRPLPRSYPRSPRRLPLQERLPLTFVRCLLQRTAGKESEALISRPKAYKDDCLLPLQVLLTSPFSDSIPTLRGLQAFSDTASGSVGMSACAVTQI